MSQETILLVDDEQEIVEQYARALKSGGYEVDTAFSGEEAWDKYQARYYDVVIADWVMEKMNGSALLRKIDQMHPFAKVIIITGFSDKSKAIEAHHYHAFDYLEKPIDMDELLNKVQEAIQRKDGVIAALEDWVATHPEEASQPLKATLSEEQEVQVWSAKEILEEIKRNTERGRQEYQNLVQLTIDLLTRGRIQSNVER
ncbi:response regulator [Candidatus Poribacteria bacterium]|nr:response regulator [Candidatus Poribacteria bacterium]